MQAHAIGIDAVDIDRFHSILKKKKRSARFFENTFSKDELHYCSAYKDSAPHFAGTFAAKEAVIKALGGMRASLSSLEIRREGGKPVVWIAGKRSKKVVVSITHSRTLACAIALKMS